MPNRDAVRIAEQIRSQVKQRPAVVLIAPMEEESSSSALSRQVAQRISQSGEESTLLIELRLSDSDASVTSVYQIPSGPDKQGESLLRSKEVSIAPGLWSLALGAREPETVRESFSANFKRILLEVCGRYTFVLISGVPIQEVEIFGIVASSNLCVVCLKRGKSSRSVFEAFRNDCSLISDAAVGVVLES